MAHCSQHYCFDIKAEMNIYYADNHKQSKWKLFDWILFTLCLHIHKYIVAQIRPNSFLFMLYNLTCQITSHTGLKYHMKIVQTHVKYTNEARMMCTNLKQSDVKSSQYVCIIELCISRPDSCLQDSSQVVQKQCLRWPCKVLSAYQQTTVII